MKGLDQLVIAKIGNSVISTNNKKKVIIYLIMYE